MSQEVVGELEIIAFLKAGETTRETVLLRLGTPSSQFEQGRLLTYQITAEGELFWPRTGLESQVMTFSAPTIFSVVLVFSDHGILERYKVIGALDS